jgi:hypothetical protein
MSVHLEVEPALLSVTAGHLRRAVDVAEDFTARRGALVSLVDDAGSERLCDAAGDFLGRWGYGMGLVVDDAAALAERLEAAQAAYVETEGTIAGAMG